MFPPSQGLQLDIDAISQICGSVSIACWIVVFSPQIIENWKRSSADGLSIVFILVWLLGDIFNILGAVLQGVLPTMIILAVYYTLADIVLLFQCFYYKGFTLKDEVKKPTSSTSEPESTAAERSALLSGQENTNGHTNGHRDGHSSFPSTIDDMERRHSQSSLRDRLLSVDGTHLSPATPLVPGSDQHLEIRSQAPQSTLQTVFFNLTSIVLVCAAGILGWWLSTRSHPRKHPEDKEPDENTLHFNPWGQVFGYICAILYLGSRVPQLLLNYRRKSTEGISMLFFLFACIGNLMYVLSIFAFKPVCHHPTHCELGEMSGIYARYIAVNLSWLLGSFGTLLLDAGVFVQYFLYKDYDEVSEDEHDD